MLTVSEDKMMKAVCCAMPSGETLWFNAEEGSEYLSKVIEAWKDQHPEYANTESTMGGLLKYGCQKISFSILRPQTL